MKTILVFMILRVLFENTQKTETNLYTIDIEESMEVHKYSSMHAQLWHRILHQVWWITAPGGYTFSCVSSPKWVHAKHPCGLTSCNPLILTIKKTQKDIGLHLILGADVTGTDVTGHVQNKHCAGKDYINQAVNNHKWEWCGKASKFHKTHLVGGETAITNEIPNNLRPRGHHAHRNRVWWFKMLARLGEIPS